MLDIFLGFQFSRYKETIQTDMFSLLHIIISIQKHTKDITVRQCLRNSISFIINQIKSIDKSRFANLQSNRERKDEFERIVQFLAVISSEISFNPVTLNQFFEALFSVTQIIESIDLSKQNAKNLAFMISCYGRNCLYDETVLRIRDQIYNLIRQNEVKIYDIVECFNSLMNLDILSFRDLKATGLDQ